MRTRNINSLKGFVILNALLLFFAFSASNAFADFYVIAGSRGVGTQIKSLPYTISSPGFYYITKDLTVSGSHGITVTADHVTLDLMGFSLIGSGSGAYDGVYMSLRTNVEIRNGTVRNFGQYGIRDASALGKGHRIINIRVEGNGSYGIWLAGKSHLVKGCTALENGSRGIYAYNGSTITGNTCYNNQGDGIYAKDGSTITGNTCYNNQDDGIFAETGSTITGNTCYNNTDHGIYLCGYSLVDQNTAYSNATNINTCATCAFGTNYPP